MRFAILGLEGAPHEFRLLAPDHTLALLQAEHVFLVVDGPEQRVAAHTNREDERRAQVRQLDRMPRQILHLQRVHGGQPDCGAPPEIEAEVVVGHVDCAEIPGAISGETRAVSSDALPALVEEEIHNVYGVKDVYEYD